MKTRSKFIKSIVAAAKDETVALPWERGTRRAAFIAKRKVAQPLRRSA